MPWVSDGLKPSGAHDQQLLAGDGFRVWRKIYRLFIVVLGTVVFGAFAIAGLFYLTQNRLIYLPRTYEVQPGRVLPLSAGLERKSRLLSFQTSQGKQVAAYIGDDHPKKVWLMCGGNGALALDWLPTLRTVPVNADIGYLLVDYPGYGWCEGKPNPEAIQESIAGALASLAGDWGVTVDDIHKRISCMGHSLGAAVILEASVRMKVQEIIVISPFTSMQEMAGLVVSSLAPPFVRHRYDNVKSLQRLRRIDGVKVVLFHGKVDRVIPVSMGQTLERQFSKMIEYHEIARAGHNDIFSYIHTDLAGLLGGRR